MVSTLKPIKVTPFCQRPTRKLSALKFHIEISNGQRTDLLGQSKIGRLNNLYPVVVYTRIGYLYPGLPLRGQLYQINCVQRVRAMFFGLFFFGVDSDIILTHQKQSGYPHPWCSWSHRNQRSSGRKIKLLFIHRV